MWLEMVDLRPQHVHPYRGMMYELRGNGGKAQTCST